MIIHFMARTRITLTGATALNAEIVPAPAPVIGYSRHVPTTCSAHTDWRRRPEPTALPYHNSASGY